MGFFQSQRGIVQPSGTWPASLYPTTAPILVRPYAEIYLIGYFRDGFGGSDVLEQVTPTSVIIYHSKYLIGRTF